MKFLQDGKKMSFLSPSRAGHHDMNIMGKTFREIGIWDILIKAAMARPFQRVIEKLVAVEDLELVARKQGNELTLRRCMEVTYGDRLAHVGVSWAPAQPLSLVAL